MQADVSIIIPTHDRSDLLVTAVESCATSGPGLQLEIIVVDDASTQDIGAAMAGRGVIFRRLDRNVGSSSARNQGLDLATGRYVKFLDSDDVLVEGALRCEFDAALQSDADIVVAGWIDTLLSADGKEVSLATHRPPHFDSILDDLLAGRAVPTSSALYKASIAKHTAWDPALAKVNDWDYFVAAALRSSRIVRVDGPSYRWRQHSGARITSSASFASGAREFYVILDKLEATLKARNEYTQPRRERMAQYLYKELRGMYRFGEPSRREILRKILWLDPRFVARDEERSALFRTLLQMLPMHWVLSAYGVSRRAVDCSSGFGVRGERKHGFK
jgi:glycosyltransferase involved in cell wall biosynthesis